MIWIIGCQGLLGSRFVNFCQELKIPYIGSSREINLMSSSELSMYFTSINPKLVINCAAYTDVEKAEIEKITCFDINVRFPALVGQIVESSGAELIHFSSDYVYGNLLNNMELDRTLPIDSSTKTDPINWYGTCKQNSEEQILTMCRNAYVIRTSWLYGVSKPNFVTKMINLLIKDNELRVVSDQYSVPTWIDDLVRAVLETVSFKVKTKRILHVCNSGHCSRLEYVSAIQDFAYEFGLIQRKVNIIPVSLTDFPTLAKRPHWSVLKSDIQLPYWKDSLKKFIHLYSLGNLYA